MAFKVRTLKPKERDRILEVVLNARRQQYTPELLCEFQKIIETKYYYWWLMDLKKEEYAVELFTKDFRCYHNGQLAAKNPITQAKHAKWSNLPMVTSHMGHQPLVWIIDESHARGVFQYEDHHVYTEDGYTVETRVIYCDDFVKEEDGCWHSHTMRMYQYQTNGEYRNPLPPKGWEPEEWDSLPEK